MNQASDTTVALRAAIKEVLANANMPLTSKEIATHPAVASVDASLADATLCVAHLYLLKSRGFPMMRAPINGNKFVYFNPDVVTPSDAILAKAEELLPVGRSSVPVNSVNPGIPAPVMKSGDFQFNPVELAAELASPPAKRKTKAEAAQIARPVYEAAAVPVQVPAGVKCITLSVAGVSIKIELG